MKGLRAKFLATLLAVTMSVSTVQGAEKITLSTPSGYQTDAWIYEASGDERVTGIVFIHGKRGNPSSDHNDKFIRRMTAEGYKVVAPLMPWSEKRGYEGTREQGLEVMSAAVSALGKERIVVVGHSMGGVGALQYGAVQGDDATIGLVSIAAGHDPSMSWKFRNLTGEKAAEACGLMEAGNGAEKDDYPEMNMGKRYTITASAEYYCTYYSVDEYPATGDLVFDIETPVLWISAENDRLTKIYAHKTNFDALGENSKHRYELLPGKHKSVLFKHVNVISEWIEGL